MPLTPLSNVLRRPDQAAAPLPPELAIDLDESGLPTERMDGAAKITELPDGAAVIDLSPVPEQKVNSDKHNANLADAIDDTELNKIASDLIQGIEQDDASRSEWLTTHADGLKLLGLTVEDSRSDTGSSGAPVEGMSQVRHPLLLDAVLFFQATARGELLPAAGPVKIRNDRPQKPMMGHNGGPPLDAEPLMAPPAMPPAMPPQSPMAAPGAVPPPMPGAGAPPQGVPPMPSPPIVPPQEPAEPMRDSLADALEKDFNHYLTTTAQEYYPDTYRMLFTVGFGGQGIKKVYNCPLRRRPVSESVPMEDFIVSNALTDLGNAARITHRIKMRPSILRRMQLLKVYRDIPLGTPQPEAQNNQITQAKAEIVGVQAQPQDPRDNDYELYECYCELELDQFAPPKFKKKGLALPYRVTIERTSRKILDIRRNWKEDDEECLPREFFVEFSYDKAFGFYGIGLLHILGNTTKTLTAAWRELIDSGMYANFPGFIYAKGAGRQLTNQFRVPPGGGVGLDIGLQRLQDAVMPLPYKDLGPAFVAFIQRVEELGQRVGGIANTSVGEGRADAPVGTTLALIEQSTKPIGAVLKGLHSSQSKELQLLKERFKDDPEAFWRFNKRPATQWQKDQFIAALEDFDLVPVSDPNNPTKMHRAAKAQTLVQMATTAPGLLDAKKVFIRAADELQIENPQELLAPPMPAQQPPVDQAKMAQAQAKIEGDRLRAEAELKSTMVQQQGDLAELQLRREIALINQDTERLRLASTVAMHADKSEAAERMLSMKLGAEMARAQDDRIHQQSMAAQERQVAPQTGEQP